MEWKPGVKKSLQDCEQARQAFAANGHREHLAVTDCQLLVG
jgi:hypothetical protein